MGDSCNAAVISVSSSKSVVHINITQSGKLLSKKFDSFYKFWWWFFKWSFLFLVKADVLTKEDFSLGIVNLWNNTFSDTVFKESYFSTQWSF